MKTEIRYRTFLRRCCGRRIIQSRRSDTLKQFMYSTVTGGTAKTAKVDGYSMEGGKTGTAQKAGRDGVNYLVSFIGFAPVERSRACHLLCGGRAECAGAVAQYLCTKHYA